MSIPSNINPPSEELRIRADEVLGDAIHLSLVEYVLTYEWYETREVWLARRLWVTSGSS